MPPGVDSPVAKPRRGWIAAIPGPLPPTIRGDREKKWFERTNRLQSQFLTYHRLENYFRPDAAEDAAIEYQGDAYSIIFSGGLLHVEEAARTAPYELPQIMYVPAERNFISYVRHPQELKGLSTRSIH